MGLRDKVKGRVKNVLSKLSGEHSDGAQEMGEFKEFDRDLEKDPNREVVMARLNRPKTTR